MKKGGGGSSRQSAHLFIENCKEILSRGKLQVLLLDPLKMMLACVGSFRCVLIFDLRQVGFQKISKFTNINSN
jgi:hypothetical protein